MDGGYLGNVVHADDQLTIADGALDAPKAKSVRKLRRQTSGSTSESSSNASKDSGRPAVAAQTALWPADDMPLAYSQINRRRSLIRRLDHLLEDATNEQFYAATAVLRDALERLRLALLKDTQLP